MKSRLKEQFSIKITYTSLFSVYLICLKNKAVFLWFCLFGVQFICNLTYWPVLLTL